MLTRRKSLGILGSALVTPLVSRAALAQTYPSKPVKIVVGFPAGGPTDANARLIAPWLSDRLGQQFIVENRAGASGTLAVESVVRAAPDGYTLLLVSSSDTVAQSTYTRISYSIVRDLAAVSPINQGSMLLMVNPTLPVKNISELIAYAKSHPGKLNYASTGMGSLHHLCTEYFKMLAGLDAQHVPYRGSAPALTDLIAGNVDLFIDSITTSIEHVRSGRLRLLGVSTAKPIEALPNAPTVAASVPGFEVGVFSGIAAPKGTPATVINLLNREIRAAVDDPKIKAWAETVGREGMLMTPQEFGTYLAADIEKWTKVAKFANIKVE